MQQVEKKVSDKLTTEQFLGGTNSTQFHLASGIIEEELTLQIDAAKLAGRQARLRAKVEAFNQAQVHIEQPVDGKPPMPFRRMVYLDDRLHLDDGERVPLPVMHELILRR